MIDNRDNFLAGAEVNQTAILGTPGVPHGDNPAGIAGPPVPGLRVGDFAKLVLPRTVAQCVEQHSGLDVFKHHGLSPFPADPARA